MYILLTVIVNLANSKKWELFKLSLRSEISGWLFRQSDQCFTFAGAWQPKSVGGDSGFLLGYSEPSN